MSTCNVVKLMETLNVICYKKIIYFRQSFLMFFLMIPVNCKTSKIANAFKFVLTKFTWAGDSSCLWYSVSEVNEMDFGKALEDSHSL